MRIFAQIALLLVFASTGVMAKGVVVQHQAGLTEVPVNPERVAVIGVAPLDVLDSLGIEPVAVNKGAYLPDYLKKYVSDQYASSGSLFEPDYESIYMAKPDLIIVGIRSAANFKALSEIAPTIVFSIDSHQGYWKSTKKQWEVIGRIFSIEDRVKAKEQELEAAFREQAEHNEGMTALTVMRSGNNLTTFGENSRFSSIYKDFGYQEAVKHIRENKHGDVISYEFIREANPDTLLILDRDKLTSGTHTDTTTGIDNDLVRQTSAYKNNRIAYLDIGAWYVAAGGVTATQIMLDNISQLQ